MNYTHRNFYFFRIVLIFIILTSMLTVTPATKASAVGEVICYVQWNLYTGNNDGSSWANAYGGGYIALQYALQNDSTCTQIWVAKGYYYPTDGNDRTTTFQLKNGVTIYGGFAGTETSLSQRDPLTNKTYLMGNINDLSIQTDNVFHVVTGSNTNSTAILDGFNISAGYANDTALNLNKNGAGMYISGGNPTIRNVIFENNYALSNGGGMSVTNSSNPTLTNVTFKNNVAEVYGGGMYNSGSSNPTLTNVTFENNLAVGLNGGGMYNASNSNPILTNVTFLNNSAGNDGGGMYNTTSSPTLTKITFTGNSAKYGGGMATESSPAHATLTNVTFKNNNAINYGGGMQNEYGSDAILINVTFDNNTADMGGGMYNFQAGMVSMANVTFSNNMANQIGGGLYNHTSNPRLTNVIFHGNSAGGSGGGIINGDSSPVIRNTILWGNTANSGAQIKDGSSSFPVVSDSVIQGGYPGGSNIITSDPKLGALGNHGGFTETIPLLWGSSAIDKGNDSVCEAAVGAPAFGAGAKDQRGVARPKGTHCDIGAYELKTGKKVFKSQPKYDGWVLESGESSGAGGTKNNLNNLLLLGDNAQDKQYRAILSFGTATLPDNAVITKVILKVKKAGVVGTNPFSTHFNLLADIRKAPFSSNKALQLIDFQASAGMNAAGTFNKTLKAGNWYQVTMKKTSRKYVNKKGVTQFRLRFGKDDNDDNSADILKLFSGNAILAYRPTLIINYYVP